MSFCAVQYDVKISFVYSKVGSKVNPAIIFIASLEMSSFVWSFLLSGSIFKSLEVLLRH